jgi:hypothetical protein
MYLEKGKERKKQVERLMLNNVPTPDNVMPSVLFLFSLSIWLLENESVQTPHPAMKLNLFWPEFIVFLQLGEIPFG